jgi:predicted amidohydrolase YtcJ
MTDPGHLDFDTLDTVSTEVPVVVVNKSGHIVYGNRKSFELAQVTDGTPNPVGGSYQRDPEGHVTGVGYEIPAVVRLVSVVNHSTSEQYAEMTKKALQILADAGYTTVTDLGLGLPLPTQEQHIEILRQASEAPDALLRIQGYVVTNLLNQIPKLQEQNSDWFKVLGLKIWSDGSVQGHTAAMKKDYKDIQTKGALNFSQEQLTSIVMSARKQKIQVAIHANGDQAIEDTLIAFEAAQKAYPSDDPRFRIEHASIVDPEQWKQSFREKELGSIEVGKFADFVILSQNPKKTDPDKIKDIQIVERWLNGKKKKTTNDI